MAKKIIIACAAGGRGDPCTQCESEKRKVARGALLCSQGRWSRSRGQGPPAPLNQPNLPALKVPRTAVQWRGPPCPRPSGTCKCAVRLSSIRVRAAHGQLTPSRAGRGTRVVGVSSSLEGRRTIAGGDQLRLVLRPTRASLRCVTPGTTSFIAMYHGATSCTCTRTALAAGPTFALA